MFGSYKLVKTMQPMACSSHIRVIVITCFQLISTVQVKIQIVITAGKHRFFWNLWYIWFTWRPNKYGCLISVEVCCPKFNGCCVVIAPYVNHHMTNSVILQLSWWCEHSQVVNMGISPVSTIHRVWYDTIALDQLALYRLKKGILWKAGNQILKQRWTT